MVRPFRSPSLEDLPAVGGENAALGERVRALEEQGVPVPDGFAVTAAAYRGRPYPRYGACGEARG